MYTSCGFHTRVQTTRIEFILLSLLAKYRLSLTFSWCSLSSIFVFFSFHVTAVSYKENISHANNCCITYGATEWIQFKHTASLWSMEHMILLVVYRKCWRWRLCSNLIPKANAWLLENAGVRLIKCETIEKKVTRVDEITTENVLFVPSDNIAIYVKGLRYRPLCLYNLGCREPLLTSYVTILKTGS